MKRLAALGLSALVVVAASACGSSDNASSSTSSSTPAPAGQPSIAKHKFGETVKFTGSRPGSLDVVVKAPTSGETTTVEVLLINKIDMPITVDQVEVELHAAGQAVKAAPGRSAGDPMRRILPGESTTQTYAFAPTPGPYQVLLTVQGSSDVATVGD